MFDDPTEGGGNQPGFVRDGENTAPSTSPAVLEALEICAGSVLALEASLDKLPAGTRSDRDARDTIQAAIELVTAALETVRGQAPGTPSSELALGFVTRRVRSRQDAG